MYRFTRRNTLKTTAVTPKAVGFAMELTGYLNKTYGVHVICGMEMFGGANIHWHFEVDTLEKISEINGKLLEDKTYWSMLEKGKEYFLEGAVKDTVVMFPK